MKYHLETIPVWDAYKEDSECPLCILENKAEKQYIDFFLGSSVMEPDVRIEVNKIGFCPEHFTLLYKVQNRLGLALLTHTHLKETIEKFKKQTAALMNEQSGSFLFSKMIKRKTEKQNPVDHFYTQILKQRDNCMICNRINEALKRYTYTILHLWDNDQEFKKQMMESKGFCLYHFASLVHMAGETLSARKCSLFLEDIIPLQMKALERLENELFWFTQKFDYRNQDKPWGNSKDSLPRTLQKLTGKYME